MKFTSALVLAALSAGSVVAATVGHAGFKHNHAARHADLLNGASPHRENSKRDINHLAPRDMNTLLSLGVKALGLNPTSNTSPVWIGNDGKYTNEFFNQGAEDMILVVWGPVGSWVNAIQPLVTITIPVGQSRVLSFADGASGAWAPVTSGTTLVNGQISQTWGEYTFGQWGVVDVSREVNMHGINMRIVGPTCTTDMQKCVFACLSDSLTSCWLEYDLYQCENGSQIGATKGKFAGAASGGCGGMGSSAKLQTYIGYAGDATIHR